jgi:hypothetical protein
MIEKLFWNVFWVFLTLFRLTNKFSLRITVWHWNIKNLLIFLLTSQNFIIINRSLRSNCKIVIKKRFCINFPNLLICPIGYCYVDPSNVHSNYTYYWNYSWNASESCLSGWNPFKVGRISEIFCIYVIEEVSRCVATCSIGSLKNKQKLYRLI